MWCIDYTVLTHPDLSNTLGANTALGFVYLVHPWIVELFLQCNETMRNFPRAVPRSDPVRCPSAEQRAVFVSGASLLCQQPWACDLCASLYPHVCHLTVNETGAVDKGGV